MNAPHVGLDRTSRSIVSAVAGLAVAFTVLRFGIARHAAGTGRAGQAAGSGASRDPRMRVAA